MIGRRPEGVRLAGLWEFPGGKLEAGEAPRDCLVREMHEELDLDVEISRGLDIIVHADHDLSVTLHPFICRMPGASAPPPVIHPRANSELRWVTARELGDYPFPRANAPLVACLRTMLAGPADAQPERLD